MIKIHIKKAAMVLALIPSLISLQVPFSAQAEELSSGDFRIYEETEDNAWDSNTDILSDGDFSYEGTSAGAAEQREDPQMEKSSVQDELLNPEEDLAAGELASGEELLSADGGNEDGIAYIKGRPLTEAERAEECSIPVEAEIPVFDVESTGSFSLMGVGDAERTAYNAAALGYVTPVKNQGSYNNCWAFSVASLMETSLIAQGLGSADTLDLSEEHLSYYFSNRENDPLGNSAGDLTTLKNGYKGNNNPWMVCMHLSTWSGMAVESDPIPGAYDTTAYLKDALFVKGPSRSELKSLIRQYKSVGALTYFNAGSIYYNPDTAALCNASSSSVNHAVTIVGWDDGYSYKNFSTASGVTTDGAWIVKNSYGPNKGDHGYIYISYEDPTLTGFTCLTAQLDPGYAENYFYDGSTLIEKLLRVRPGESVACVFEAKAGDGYVETLGEVVLASSTAGAGYGIQVYTGITDPSDPSGGVPAYSSPAACHVTYPGIATVGIPEVDIAPGTCYSIVVTNLGSEDISYYIDKDNTGSFYTTYAHVEPQQGFYKTGGAWMDLYNSGYSPRVKAHTKVTSEKPSVTAEKSSVTLTWGSSYQFSPIVTPASLGSSGFVYSSSDPETASVSEDGVVTALACGETVITAVCREAPGLSISLAVKTVPNTPANVKVEARNVYQIRLSWNKVEGADGYRIWRKDGSGGWFVRRTMTSVNSLSYIDQDNYDSRVFIVPRTNYQYYVVAYKDVDGVRYHSPASPTFSVKPDFANKNVATRTNENFRTTVEWYTEEGVSGYYLDRSFNGAPFENVDKYESFSGNKLSYTDTDVQRLQRYVYRVRPYRVIDGKECFGRWLYGTTIRASAGVTWIRYTTAEPGKITISFNFQPASSGYFIYRKPYGGSYVRIAELSDSYASTYVDTTVVKGVKYQYAVRTYVKEYYGGVLSTYRAGSFVTAE